MDWMLAMHYARLVQHAESIRPNAIHGDSLEIVSGEGNVHHDILTTVFANDLATRCHPRRSEIVVSIGYVAQSAKGDVVIVFRGTQGIHEWLIDCEYKSVPCPVRADAGQTEDGFTAIYESLRVGRGPQAQRLLGALLEMQFPRPVRSVTIAGHSLGAALATLCALDVATNTHFNDVSLFTYASPRTGDKRFTEVFKTVVPRAYRIANQCDVITEAPPEWVCQASPYCHVEESALLMPANDHDHHLFSNHHMTTYIALMEKQMEIVNLAAAAAASARVSEE